MGTYLRVLSEIYAVIFATNTNTTRFRWLSKFFASMSFWQKWLVQNFAKCLRKSLNIWHMGTHLRVLSEVYPMNTNMTGFRCF